MVAPLSIWWIRIILFGGWVSGGIAVLLALSPDAATTQVALTLYLAGGVLGIELLRPGGSFFTSGLGLTPRAPKAALVGGGLALGALGLLAGTATLMGATFVPGTSVVLWYGVLGLVSQSVAEEFLFRGTLLEALRERFGSMVAVGITALLFGLAHGTNPGASPFAVVNVILAGVLLGMMVVRSGSLWMAMVFHAVWNVSTAAFFGTVSGVGSAGWFCTLETESMPAEMVWFVTGTFGIEQGVITMIVLVAGIVVVNGWVSMDRAVGAARIRRSRREGLSS